MSKEYNHGDCFITPRYEYVVLVGYDQHATMMNMSKAEYLSMQIHADIKSWLESLGPVARKMEDSSETHPWRHRPFIPGTRGIHAFFFYHRKHALLFKLRWT